MCSGNGGAGGVCLSTCVCFDFCFESTMDSASEKRNQIARMNRIASEILRDRKKSNLIVDLIEELTNADGCSEQLCDTLIRCNGKVFTHLIDTREMIRLQVKCEKDRQENESLNTYKLWLAQLYESVADLFVKIVSNQEKKFSLNTRKLALLSTIRLIEEEGKFPFRPIQDENESSFPRYLLRKLVQALISESVYNQELISVYATYYQYDDFIHYTLQALHEIIDTCRGDNDIVLLNIIDFIHPIRLIAPEGLLPKALQPEVKERKKRKQKGPTGVHKTWIRLCELQPMAGDGKNYVPIARRKFKLSYVRDAKLYSSLWVKFLRFDLPPSTYKRALLYLDKFALQHFENPLLLSDFLISSFQTGGIISLLSLSPLYVLMHKCNLEYSDFFQQLYCLLEPAITYVKYRARFLFWCDLFLTTTHISAQIVASFVKKMSRLALTSPPDTILILLPFIGNLFIRHPTIQSMLARKEFVPENDTFRLAEANPEKTNAMHSYVWELNLLESHYLPEIANLAKQISHSLPKIEWNLEEILETKIADIIQTSREPIVKVKKLTYDLTSDLFYSL